MKLLCVAGARPNFIKVAALMRAFAKQPFEARLVHTGQHSDQQLSDVFFRQLAIPKPDVELGVGLGTQTEQSAEIMRRFETVLESEQPHAVVVVGDVSSTLACALAASKFRLRAPFAWAGRRRARPLIVHVEAGLRSFDDEMPEEINRRLTDALSDLLFVSDPAGLENLAREGVAAERVHLVGNVMIDTLLQAREAAQRTGILAQLGLREREYGLVTLHRPANVDDPRGLRELLLTLDEIAQRLRLVFPVHPRTRARLSESGVELARERWTTLAPVGYLECLALQSGARIVLTDSGGVQEETTVLGIPCVTLRDSTERPCTVWQGTNVIAGTGRTGILRAAAAALDEPWHREGRVPALWDGKAAERVAEILARRLRDVARAA